MTARRRAAAAGAAGLLVVLLAADRGPIRDPVTSTTLTRPSRLVIGSGVNVARRRISLGILAPLTGRDREAGRALVEGARTYVAARNASGGVAGWRMRLIVRDTGGDVRRHQRRFTEIASHVAAFQQSFGFVATQAVLARARRLGLMIVAPGAQAEPFVHDPSIAAVAAPAAVDAANAVAFVGARARRAARVGLITDATRNGRESLRGYAAATPHGGVRDIGRFVVTEDGANGTATLRRLRRAHADVVVVAAPASTVGALVRAAARVRYRPRWLLLGSSWSASLMTRGGLDGRPLTATGRLLAGHAWVATHAAAWGDRRVPGMRRFLAAVRKQRGDVAGRSDPGVVEGFASAAMMARVLARALADNDVSTRGILDARLGLGDIALGGLTADLRYTPRLGPVTRATAIATVDARAPGFTRTVRDFAAAPAARSLTFGR